MSAPDRYHAVYHPDAQEFPWAIADRGSQGAVIAHAASEALANKIVAALNAMEPERKREPNCRLCHDTGDAGDGLGCPECGGRFLAPIRGKA